MALTDKLRALLGRGDSQAREQQDFLRGEADMIADRVDRYRLAEDYYDGDQRTELSARARKYLEASGMRFAENFCETVVDTMADRLKVVGLQVEDDEDASEWLNKRLWPKARLDEVQGVVHTETTKLGDGFVIVDWDAKAMRPRVRWNRPHIVKPTYDDGNMDLLHLSKVWPTSAVAPTNPDGKLISRMNLYFPDRVEKWFTTTAGDDAQWQPHLDDGDPSWPIWWTRDLTETGEPLGIAAVHFRNKPKGRVFGRSELRGVIPMQDELNKLLIDLNEITDMMAGAQRWATGVTAEDGPLKVAIGEYLRATSPDAKFGQLDAADPTRVLATIESLLTRMAARSRTPLHDLSMKGQIPSGESLKTAEGGQVKKCIDRQITHGNGWQQVASLSLALQNAFGDEPVEVDPDADITVVWDSPETRNEQAEALTLSTYYDLGLSRRTILREAGYDPDEEMAERAKEDAALAPAPPDVPTNDPPPADPAADPAAP